MLWALEIVIIIGLVIVASELKKISETLRRIHEHLNDHLNGDSQLLVKLFGDERMERRIEKTNELGATLTDEQLAYTTGILVRMKNTLDRIASALN